MTRIRVSTTGNSPTVTINDLGGLTLTHPVVDLDLVRPTGSFTLINVQDSIDSGDLGVAITATDITLSDGNGNPVTPGEDVGNFVRLTEDETIQGRKTFNDDLVLIDSPTAGATLQIGYFDDLAPADPNSFGFRRADGSGILSFGSNANVVQFFLGDPTNTGGSYIDATNNQELRLNVLDTGVNDPGRVSIGIGGLTIVGSSELSPTNPLTVFRDDTSPILSFEVESDGTITAGATTAYETLVLADNDIPNKKYVDDEIAAASGTGETNTASNLGAGVGVFDGKVGVDLQFRSLVSQNNRLTIALDAPNDEIDFTINEANIDHDALTNFVANEHIDWTIDQGATNINNANIELALNDLTDVNVPAPPDGSVLAWNGTAWDDTALLRVGVNGCSVSTTDDTGLDWCNYQVGASGSAFQIMKKANGTIASPTVLNAGEKIGGIGFIPYDGQAAEPGFVSAQILANATETQSATNGGAEFQFQVTPNGTKAPITPMTLANNGFLSITANDAGHVLSVRNDAVSGELIRGINLNGIEVLQINTDGGGNGIFRIMNNAGVNIIEVEADTITTEIAGYEANVTADNDIPNKKYVDDRLIEGYVETNGGSDNSINYNNTAATKVQFSGTSFSNNSQLVFNAANDSWDTSFTGQVKVEFMLNTTTGGARNHITPQIVRDRGGVLTIKLARATYVRNQNGHDRDSLIGHQFFDCQPGDQFYIRTIRDGTNSASTTLYDISNFSLRRIG